MGHTINATIVRPVAVYAILRPVAPTNVTPPFRPTRLRDVPYSP